LVAVAVVIVVGTLVEDWLTLGAGMGDDPASFALASGICARGIQMLRGAPELLPIAGAPTALSLTVRLEERARRRR